MLIDEIMPTYQFTSGVHSTTIYASPERTFGAIKGTRAVDIPSFRALFWLRSLPAYLTGRSNPYFADDDTPILEQARSRLGFVVLAEALNQEIVLGSIGKWWSPRGAKIAEIRDAEEFLAFDSPGFARAAGNFHLAPDLGADSLNLSHETRVYTPDANSRRKFAIYWTIVYPGVVLIRKMWLRSIKQHAESA